MFYYLNLIYSMLNIRTLEPTLGRKVHKCSKYSDYFGAKYVIVFVMIFQL